MTTPAPGTITFTKKTTPSRNWRDLVTYWVKVDGKLIGTVTKSQDSTRTGGLWHATDLRGRYVSGAVTRGEAAKSLARCARPA